LKSAEWDWEAISARFQNDAALAIPCPQRLRLLGDYFLDDSRHGFTLPATALLAAKLKVCVPAIPSTAGLSATRLLLRMWAASQSLWAAR
jgi:hypothetical protein